MGILKEIFNRLKVLSKNRRVLVIVLVLIILSGFFGWRFLGKKKASPQYQTATVERGTIVSSVSTSGQILTANIINVTSNASGLVKRIYVKDGDRVTAGQKILELALDSDSKQRSSSAYSSYLSAKNSLDSAVTTL